jgi:L-threonylcarbamoyladenylate synthase
MQTIILDNTKQSIQTVAHALQSGKVVALPTETVYGLFADASDDVAVQKIFEAKQRPADNPLILHVRDVGQIDFFVSRVTPLEQLLIDHLMP